MVGEGLSFLGQFRVLPPAAWIALLGLAALISAACIYVLLRQREEFEGMKRAPFYGARVRRLATTALILLVVALISVLAVLRQETTPAAGVEETASATPMLLPSVTFTPTATLTLSTTPTPSVTPIPSATAVPAATTVPAATFSPTATSTLRPATVVPSPSISPELSPTATSTLETEGILRRVVLTGELEALKRDGEIIWPAVQLQCWNVSGQEIAQIGLTQVDGTYRLPADTAQVQLWIGSELGGAEWWRSWDSLPADVTSPEIILVIARVKREVSPPTAVPPPPVPPPTHTPCPP